jgi:hypothetical protein
LAISTRIHGATFQKAVIFGLDIFGWKMINFKSLKTYLVLNVMKFLGRRYRLGDRGTSQRIISMFINWKVRRLCEGNEPYEASWPT